MDHRTRYFGERGLYATTDYIYLYVSEDGIVDKNIVSVEKGYKGSSKDHYYRPSGATEEASRLLHREH